MRKTIAAHIPCNFAGPQFERALRSASWTDGAVIHDASPDLSVSRLAKSIRPDAIVVEDRDPDIRSRLLRHKDATAHDFILWVQADEDWSGPIATEIVELLERGTDAAGMTALNESFYFLESFGSRGPYCRVVRRDRLRFTTKSLHDMPDPEGEIVALRHRFLHFQDQNMLLFWVKNYKYGVVEYLLEGRSTCDETLSFEGKKYPLFAVLKYVAKINYHFLKGLFEARGKGLAGFFWAQDLMIRQIVVHLVPLEARRLAARHRQYETHGHFEMPLLPEPSSRPHESRPEAETKSPTRK